MMSSWACLLASLGLISSKTSAAPEVLYFQNAVIPNLNTSINLSLKLTVMKSVYELFCSFARGFFKLYLYLNSMFGPIICIIEYKYTTESFTLI